MNTIKIQEGQRVLVRASLNAPDTPEDNERLRQSARTIRYCLERGARVTIIGHKGDAGDSLASIHTRLLRYVPHSFVRDVVGKEAMYARDRCRPGEAVLLENTRCDRREQQNDHGYARELLYNAEMVIFDAFPAAHRSHASTNALLTLAPTVCTGLRFDEEIQALKAVYEPPSTSLAVLGGAKLHTKIPLLKNLLTIYDYVAVSGILANTILRMRNVEIGTSVTEEVSDISGIDEVTTHRNIILPETAVVQRSGGVRTTTTDDIKKDECIKDVYLAETVSNTVGTPICVVWNGPLGDSTQGFTDGTVRFADYLTTLPNARKVVGGGDTLSCLNDEVRKQFTFVSTGGGAMLHYLTHHTLPVLEILNV